jgi:hypothetical protein
VIDLHYWTTPNGHKITIALEELGLPYRIVPVNISQGDQFKPEFLAIAPNNRIPAIVDHDPADGGAPLTMFETIKFSNVTVKLSTSTSAPILIGSCVVTDDQDRISQSTNLLRWQSPSPFTIQRP